jgi:hypothetical protein
MRGHRWLRATPRSLRCEGLTPWSARNTFARNCLTTIPSGQPVMRKAWKASPLDYPAITRHCLFCGATLEVESVRPQPNRGSSAPAFVSEQGIREALANRIRDDSGFEGERNLLATLLVRAFADLLLLEAKERRHRASAITWFERGDRGLFTAAEVATYLRLDFECVREKARALADGQERLDASAKWLRAAGPLFTSAPKAEFPVDTLTSFLSLNGEAVELY